MNNWIDQGFNCYEHLPSENKAVIDNKLHKLNHLEQYSQNKGFDIPCSVWKHLSQQSGEA